MPENNQRFSPPTESTGTDHMAINRKDIDVLVNPIIEVTEVSTTAADEPVDHVSSGFLRPEQQINSPVSPRAASIAPEDQRQDNEHLT